MLTIGKLLKVGQVVNAQGIRGELKIYPFTDYKERFEELEWVYMDHDRDKKYYIEKVRYSKKLVILKLKDIDDRNTAEKHKTRYITIDQEEARQLPKDTYYIADLIDSKVYSEEKELIGILKNVVPYPTHDVYEIINDKNPHKTILIPAVSEFIKKVDIEKKMIVVKLIEGLIE